jgi:hypothetical protein
VVEIDELLVEVIKILNSKGYQTIYCCAGHAYERNPDCYITFAEGIRPPSLPVGYTQEICEYNGYETFTMRANFTIDASESQLYREILNNALITLQWAEELPGRI